MDLEPEIRGNIAVLRPRGRIDHQSADQLEAALAPHLDQCKNGEYHLVLDLTGVEYMSSVGLRVLMVASRHIEGATSAGISLCGLQPVVEEIFEISRFNQIFKVHADVESAIASAGS